MKLHLSIKIYINRKEGMIRNRHSYLTLVHDTIGTEDAHKATASQSKPYKQKAKKTGFHPKHWPNGYPK